MTSGGNKVLHIGDGLNWHFVNGRWQDMEDNMLAVPKEFHRSDGYGIQGHHIAGKQIVEVVFITSPILKWLILAYVE